MDQPNREALLRHFVPLRKMGNLTKRNRWIPKTQRVESDWIVGRKGKKQQNPMSIRLYTPAQMQGLFEQAGLTVEASYGSIGGEPYRRSSRRLIMVGRKLQ